MFDKSSDVGMIYSNPKHDYSDYIMEELGIDAQPAKGIAKEKTVKEESTVAPKESSPKQKSTTNKLK